MLNIKITKTTTMTTYSLPWFGDWPVMISKQVLLNNEHIQVQANNGQ